MSTAQTIVNNALRILNLNSVIKGVDPYHQQVGFQVLVDWLATERGKRIYITPQIPSSINSDIKEKPWAKKAIEYAVAYDLIAPLQVKEPPATLMQIKDEAYRTLYIEAAPSTEQQYPGELPRGAGNSYEYCDETFYSAADNVEYDITDTVNYQEKAIYYADFDADATLRGTTVSSVVWEVVQLTGTTVSNESLSSNLASALLSFESEGLAKIKATATYSNGEVKGFMFLIQVNRI